jgi:phosphoribosylaminoimidazole carboxylase PurE protein
VTVPRVAILLGSESDRPAMDDAVRILMEFGVDHEVVVASAHRTPDLVDRYVRAAEGRGVRVIIAAAGGAAHLAGAAAARTILPVIGVPLDATGLGGLDALLSTVQMPPGVPVATVSIGTWGARNAALLALEMLAIGDDTLRERLRSYRAKAAAAIESAAEQIMNSNLVDRGSGRGA